jgi:signal transduction histidine kinase
MDQSRPSLRLLGILLVAAVPPLVSFALLFNLAPGWVESTGQGTALVISAGATAIWAAMVAVVANRFVVDEASRMVELARRGTLPEGGTPMEEMTSAQRRMAAALDERNRQIAELAAQVRAAPIEEDATAVAHSLVRAARSMTGDPTWTLAVLRGSGDALLPGAYQADPVISPLEEVHRWASTTDEQDGARGARHAIGPWGGFVVVDVAAGDELRAILLAPWEGRAAPSPAELDLFGLLGQHAATTIEHALLYARLRHQTDALNRLAALQTDFLRGVTHDLQTPLTSIRAVAAELRDSAGLDDAARTDLDTIAHQADRLRRMVGQLLTVSRLEAGALTPAQEVFRAEPLVRRTWEALRADRPVELADEGPAHLVVGDPDRLEQVLWAVLDNAVKYSPDGSSVSIRLSACETEDGATAEIAITDAGAGMDRVTLERAFDQFYRSDDARRLSPDGSGVGLYAARGLLRAMGGEIVAESRPGGGTTMRISLPAELVEHAA